MTSGGAIALQSALTILPALQRMRQKGWITAAWKLTPNKQRARYYALTARGRAQLGIEEAGFADILNAIKRVMRSV